MALFVEERRKQLPESISGTQCAQTRLEAVVTRSVFAPDKNGRHDVCGKVEWNIGKFVIYPTDGQNAKSSGRVVQIYIIIPEKHGSASTNIPVKAFNGTNREVMLIRGPSCEPTIRSIPAISGKSLYGALIADELFERHRDRITESQANCRFIGGLGVNGHKAAKDKG